MSLSLHSRHTSHIIFKGETLARMNQNVFAFCFFPAYENDLVHRDLQEKLSHRWAFKMLNPHSFLPHPLCVCVILCLLQDMPKPLQPNFVLDVEASELFIQAGLQDRVIQVIYYTVGPPLLSNGTESLLINNGTKAMELLLSRH